MKRRFGRGRFVLIGFLAIGGYFLWAEHSAHIALAVPYLPYLLLLACPLLHIFMHSGHGHAGHRHTRRRQPSSDAESGEHVAPEPAPRTRASGYRTRIPSAGGEHD